MQKLKIKINRESINGLVLLLMGIFIQISPTMPKSVICMYLAICIGLEILANNILKMKIKNGIRWYGLFFIYSMFSLLYTVNTINPEYAVIRMIMCLIITVLITQVLNEKNFEKVITGIIVGGILGILLVLIKQYSLIGIKRLGNGIYGSYAEFGNVSMITLSCLIWKWKKSKYKSKVIIISMIIPIIAIFLSGARKAIITPILFFLLIEILDKRKNFVKKTYFVLIMSMVVIVLVYASLTNEILYKTIGYRIDSGISAILGREEEDASLTERGKFKEIAKEMILEKPILGWGLHSFAYVNYTKTGLLLYSHDTFLEILSCLGIIGFVLYFRIYYKILRKMKKMLNSKNTLGLFFISYTIVILFMEPYSMSYISLSSVVILASAAGFKGDEQLENEEYTQDSMLSNIKNYTK